MGRRKGLPVAIRRMIFERDAGICQVCGEEVDFYGPNTVSPFMEKSKAHIDHIVPVCAGGGDDPSNLRLLCMSCNCSKGGRQ